MTNPNEICQRCGKPESEHATVVSCNQDTYKMCVGTGNTFLPPTEPEGKPPRNWAIEYAKLLLEHENTRTQLAEVTKEREALTLEIQPLREAWNFLESKTQFTTDSEEGGLPHVQIKWGCYTNANSLRAAIDAARNKETHHE